MKKYYLLIAFFISFFGFSQSIIQAEYFWDNDPGTGNGISLDALDGNFNQALETVFRNTSTLPPSGNHTIGIRIKGQDGNWSATYRKVFKVIENINTNIPVKVTQAEYFWDNDPGEGNGNIMLAFDGNFNQALEAVFQNNAILPSNGNHTIGIRVKAQDGNWSAAYKKVFKLIENFDTNIPVKVTQAEYFWDNDPGEGNANIMLAFDGNFNQALETVLQSNAVLPSNGNHVIGIRVKTSNNNWSPVFRKAFRLSDNNNSNNLVKITQAEYYWDNDPGQDNGNPMLAFDGNFNQALETIVQSNANLTQEGNHILAVRVKSSDGNWSPVFKKVFKISFDTNTNATGKILSAEYFWDDDITNGGTLLAFDGNFNQTLETVFNTTTNIPQSGIHKISVRVKSEDDTWSPTYSRIVAINVVYNETITLVSPVNGSTNVPLNENLVWNTISNVSNYEYQVSTSPTFDNIVASGVLNGSTVQMNNLQINTLYYWRVRANENGNVSLWSSVWSFLTGTTLNNEDYEILSGIELYPNPTNNFLYLKTNDISEIVSYSIYSIEGKKVMENKYNSENPIDVSNLSDGMYIINFKSKNKEQYKIKFLKF